MISFQGILFSVLSQQQLKINNYNLLITLLTFSTLVLNDSPLNGSLFILNANFTKKKIYFSDFYYANKKYMGFSRLLYPDFKKITNTTEMLKKKPCSSQDQKSQVSTGPSTTTHRTCPRSQWFYSLGSRGSFDLFISTALNICGKFLSTMDAGEWELTTFSFQLSLKYGNIK